MGTSCGSELPFGWDEPFVTPPVLDPLRVLSSVLPKNPFCRRGPRKPGSVSFRAGFGLTVGSRLAKNPPVGLRSTWRCIFDCPG